MSVHWKQIMYLKKTYTLNKYGMFLKRYPEIEFIVNSFAIIHNKKHGFINIHHEILKVRTASENSDVEIIWD